MVGGADDAAHGHPATGGDEHALPDASPHLGTPDHRHRPGGAPADSAGLPWAGRTFAAHDTTFAGDDGAADPDLLAALTAVAAGTVSHAAVLDAVRGARLLVPLVSHAGDVGVAPDGRAVDKTQELSIVTVAGPDGRRVMPVFSSVDAMRSWNPRARPVPVEARRVALAAASEDTELVVLDPTAPTEFVLRRPAVWALGQGSAWVPSYEDPALADVVVASVAGEPQVVRVELAPGDPAGRLAGPELVVGLVLVPGLDAAAVGALVTRLQARWSAERYLTEHVDSLRVALRSA